MVGKINSSKLQISNIPWMQNVKDYVHKEEEESEHKTKGGGK